MLACHTKIGIWRGLSCLSVAFGQFVERSLAKPRKTQVEHIIASPLQISGLYMTCLQMDEGSKSVLDRMPVAN